MRVSANRPRKFIAVEILLLCVRGRRCCCLPLTLMPRWTLMATDPSPQAVSQWPRDPHNCIPRRFLVSSLVRTQLSDSVPLLTAVRRFHDLQKCKFLSLQFPA